MNVSLIVENVTQIKDGIMKNVNIKLIKRTKKKKTYSWNPSPCICENGTYLKSVADYSKIVCDENINVTVSTKF